MGATACQQFIDPTPLTPIRRSSLRTPIKQVPIHQFDAEYESVKGRRNGDRCGDCAGGAAIPPHQKAVRKLSCASRDSAIPRKTKKKAAEAAKENLAESRLSCPRASVLPFVLDRS